jgi:Zn-finger nucleic acid-binding protein
MDVLICPICEVSLSPIRVQQGSIWRCPTCNGVMANIAVLRRYLGGSIVQNFWRKAIAGSAVAEKKCPSCRRSLSSFKVSKDEQTIVLDICRRCQLLWFDKGELDAFPKVNTEELPAKVKRELALLKIESENQFQDELMHSENAVINVVDIFIGIIRLIAHFARFF